MDLQPDLITGLIGVRAAVEEDLGTRRSDGRFFGVVVASIMWLIQRWHASNLVKHKEEVQWEKPPIRLPSGIS